MLPGHIPAEDFAALLGISLQTLRNKLSRREIACVRIGRRTWIPQRELDRLIRAGTQPVVKLWTGNAA